MVRRSAAGGLTVSAVRHNRRLVLDIEGDGEPGAFADLEDRVGALDGSLTSARGPNGRARIHAEIPCAS
jgi:hypothetical protein